jgi:hypothetical protein
VLFNESPTRPIDWSITYIIPHNNVESTDVNNVGTIGVKPNGIVGCAVILVLWVNIGTSGKNAIIPSTEKAG